MKITLCDTSTVILLTIVIIIYTRFLPFSKQKFEWNYQSKKIICSRLVKFEFVGWESRRRHSNISNIYDNHVAGMKKVWNNGDG